MLRREMVLQHKARLVEMWKVVQGSGSMCIKEVEEWVTVGNDNVDVEDASDTEMVVDTSMCQDDQMSISSPGTILVCHLHWQFRLPVPLISGTGRSDPTVTEAFGPVFHLEGRSAYRLKASYTPSDGRLTLLFERLSRGDQTSTTLSTSVAITCGGTTLRWGGTISTACSQKLVSIFAQALKPTTTQMSLIFQAWSM